MAVKFMTIKGASTIATKPFYIGIPQHERVIGKKEAYEIAAERTGYKATAVRALKGKQSWHNGSDLLCLNDSYLTKTRSTRLPREQMMS